MNLAKRPYLLLIFDGFGYRQEQDNNAIAQAKTPVWNKLLQVCPHILISSSGVDVGLPAGQMGNSEVGHLNIGTGRTVIQDLGRINQAIEMGDFFTNSVLTQAVDNARNKNRAIHIVGLLSDGGVHSHAAHIHSMVELAARRQAKKVYVHAILDGRDSPPKSALPSIRALEKHLTKLNCGAIASLCGRYFAMDRDQRWDRTQAAYDMLTLGSNANHAINAEIALQQAYKCGETDEFVTPTCLHATGRQAHTIDDGDVIIFMNYRSDRARQLSYAFTKTDFTDFIRQKTPRLQNFVSLTQYADNLKAQIAFPPQKLTNVLGEYLASLGLTQLRIAETEKYAHVTFFFNGGVEAPFAGEERILVPSPKIATYDLQPEMSASELTEKLVSAIESTRYDVIICNYANADMVGHSGNLAATIKAVETLDQSLAKIVPALKKAGGEALITADHGNAEKMFDPLTGQAHTAHTTEPVPLLYLGERAVFMHATGALCDVAPTLLALMNLPQPIEMTGRTLMKLQ